MCGGGGTRLWPRSRAATPKQYLRLLDEKTLFQMTAERFLAAPADMDIAPPLGICGAGQGDIVADEFRQAGLPDFSVIEEPEKRNTAAVAAVAAVHVSAGGSPEDRLLLLPADHYMADVGAFWSAVRRGLPGVGLGNLVTLGIAPTRPHTGYGYIQAGEALGEDLYQIRRFVEKPDEPTARNYLAEGGYFWNAGIFLFAAGDMLDAFERHAPDILAAARDAVALGHRDGTRVQLDAAAFARSPSAPVDTAIMEKASNLAVVAPVDAGWTDLGSWAAVADVKAAGQVEARENPRIVCIDSQGCFIDAGDQAVAVVGLDNLVVVSSGDAILIMPKDRAEDVKQVVEAFRQKGRSDLL